MNALGRYRPALTVAAVLLVTGLGIAALDHLLAGVQWVQVRAAFHALPPAVIAASLLFTVLSYLALTFYDHLALRIIDRPIGWPTAALASFCSYTLSHNLGLALLTGGSARLRIYGAAGLGPGDVARIIASASLAFWGGVFTLAALAMVLHPAGIGALTLAPAAQRAIGGGLLAGAAVLIAGLGRSARSVHLLGWALTLPSRTQAVAQIGIAMVDLALASAALFILVPHASLALYPAFFLGYALAIIAALISHVPGGIGIFEAVILALLPGVDRTGLVTALIAYRILYYLLPLLVAILLIAAHEGHAWRRPARRVLGGAQMLARAIAPTMLAALVAVGGTILLVSGSLPAVPGRFHNLTSLMPTPFVEASHLAASTVGAMLILLASGLYRRLDGAFWLTRLLLVAGAIFSLMKGLDYEEAVVLLLIAALLQWSHAAFYRKTSLTSAILTPGWIATLGIAIILSIWIGFVAYRHVDYQNDLWWQFGRHQDASRFLRAAVAAGVVMIGATLWALLRPAGRIRGDTISRTPSATALALARRTDACLALTGDKLFLTSPSGRAFLMYQVQGHSWIVMGDPVGDPAEWPDLLWRMRERADAAQGRLLLYQLTLDALPLAIDLGLSIVKYGEEARIDLSAFTLDGPNARPLRHAIRRVEREGASFAIVPAADVEALLPQLRGVSDDWLAAKGATEKSFSVGRFDDAYLAQGDCAIVRCGGRIVAFANIWATADGADLSVDLMRHGAGAPPGVMDYMFTRLLLWGQAQGYGWFTLGIAPLSGLDARRLSPLWVKGAAFLYRHGDAFYGFGGLRAYKAKFAPVWEPRFIAGPQGLSLARAMVDLQRLIGGGRGSMAARMRKGDGPEEGRKAGS
ncbi:bifunctional lysylphosphatidylglycerol flippase/synthetase MprF [Sphingobium sp. HBC34]|uniref:Bifunctional lysylphosphatidylglycerol flippase/synthetase MprF n=1 Tax=Sphingobium cyanobacteriorum TaxID=3063954 RepID=A0ABT8ZQI5_9SPHN|nr:bifunctional lysylphosphatidylglycerol flippase/synthetase MprF [Sphingobium sp. HBC34]MDO7836802.1 bifunctional lysylphosphatidylglycerol flippase/synthetase MprF [Sphingobium sp. HBC34]